FAGESGVCLSYPAARDAFDLGLDGLLDDRRQVGVEPLLQQWAQQFAHHVLQRAVASGHGDGRRELAEGRGRGAGRLLAHQRFGRGGRRRGGRRLGRRGGKHVEIAVGLHLLGQLKRLLLGRGLGLRGGNRFRLGGRGFWFGFRLRFLSGRDGLLGRGRGLGGLRGRSFVLGD